MNTLDALFQGWLAGSLTETEQHELLRALADPQLAWRWRALADVEGALAERGAAIAAEPAQASANTTRRVRRVRRQHSGIIPWAVAALLLVVVGGAAMVFSPGTTVDLPTIHSGTYRGLVVGVGASVDAAAGEAVSLQWADGSTAILRGPARLTALAGVGKQVRLDTGELTVSAAPQTAEQPFVITMVAATATVVGTQFSLRSDAHQASVMVTEGTVQWKSEEGPATQVTSGEIAVAGNVRAPSADLIGWWPLDDGQGEQARDASGHGHSGTVMNGARWITDRGRAVMHLPGDDALVRIPATKALATVQAGSYSISARFRPQALPVGSISNDHDSLGVIVGRRGWTLGLHIDSKGVIFMQHFDRDLVPHTAISPSRVVIGQWRHLVGIVDRARRETRLAMDGQVVATNSWSSDLPARDYATDDAWHFGISNPGAQSSRWPAMGELADVRVYARALDAHEVAVLAAVDQKGQ